MTSEEVELRAAHMRACCSIARTSALAMDRPRNSGAT